MQTYTIFDEKMVDFGGEKRPIKMTRFWGMFAPLRRIYSDKYSSPCSSILRYKQLWANTIKVEPRSMNLKVPENCRKSGTILGKNSKFGDF